MDGDIPSAQPRFYGHYRRCRTAGALQVADLDATVPPDQVHEHAHEDAHFVLVLQGRYLSSAQGMPEVSEGLSLVFNPPGTEHRDRFATASGRFLTLSLPAADWQHMEDLQPRARIACRLGVESIVAACRIGAELRRWDASSSLVVEAECAVLAGHLTATRSSLHRRPRWLDRIIERLHVAQDDTPVLTELAHEAGVHPVYLSRAFRRHLGCTPGDYLRRQRLTHAAMLIARPGRRRLAEAAQQAGFFDQSHLHRSLRHAVGLSPSALRRLVEAIV